MSEKYTLEQVADIVECEGLGYAVQHYMGAESIEDTKLAKKWAQARKLLDDIDAILYAVVADKYDEDDSEDEDEE